MSKNGKPTIDLTNIPVEFHPTNWSEIMGFRSHPRQRNTAKHAEKALQGHLREPAATHGQFAVAMLGNERRCMLDGHTRRYLISNGLLEKPKQLTLVVYYCETEEQVDALYDHYDNRSASETSMDRVFGALSSCDYVPKSSLLAGGKGLSTALEHATKLWQTEFTDEQRIRACIEAVKIVDNWGFNQGDRIRKSSMLGLLFALVMEHALDLVMLRKVREFFLAIQEDEGKKEGKMRDGVQMLLEYSERSDQITRQQREAFMAVGVSCFNNYVSGKMIRAAVPSSSSLTSMLVRNNEKVMNGMFGDVPKKIVRTRLTSPQREVLEKAAIDEDKRRSDERRVESEPARITDKSQYCR